jgi:hypothetical protein
MVGALDQQLSQLPVTGFRDSKLWVAVARLATSRSQAEVAAYVATSLETLLVAQRQHEGQRREVTDPVDLDESLRLRYAVSVSCWIARSYCLIFTVISEI